MTTIARQPSEETRAKADDIRSSCLEARGRRSLCAFAALLLPLLGVCLAQLSWAEPARQAAAAAAPSTENRSVYIGRVVYEDGTRVKVGTVGCWDVLERSHWYASADIANGTYETPEFVIMPGRNTVGLSFSDLRGHFRHYIVPVGNRTKLDVTIQRSSKGQRDVATAARLTIWAVDFAARRSERDPSYRAMIDRLTKSLPEALSEAPDMAEAIALHLGRGSDAPRRLAAAAVLLPSTEPAVDHEVCAAPPPSAPHATPATKAGARGPEDPGGRAPALKTMPAAF